jgi:hypothetical protein
MLEFAQEDEASELLFRLLDSTLEALLAGVDRDVAARYFECWMLRLGGIFPPPDHCPQCGESLGAQAVLPPHGDTLVCLDCGCGGGASPRPPRDLRARGLVVGAGTLEFLQRIGRWTLPQAGLAAPAPGTLREVEELCARVRRQFLQRELRSYEVIQRTRAAL